MHNLNDKRDVLTSNCFKTISISESEFELIRELIFKNFGINLKKEKKSLVVGRLQKYIKQKHTSFNEYFESIEKDTSGRELSELINRISTNHTFFFRELDHFEFFKSNILPEISEKLKNEKSRDLRFWCAGCSTGDEAYSYQMMMMDFFSSNYIEWDAGVLATDISGRVLKKATKGVYHKNSLKLIPDKYKKKYFSQKGEGLWEVNKNIRDEITFRRFNLMNRVFPFKKQFHIISCRNVIMYFSKKTTESLVNKMFDMTAPGGYFFIGHSEFINFSSNKYKYVKPGIYYKESSK